jgi:CRP-like cAMP-binding protein
MIAEMCAAATNKEIIVPAIFSEGGPGHKIRAKRGDVIFRLGDPSDSVYLVTQGRVRLSVTNAIGKEATLALMGANELFGEQCLLMGKRTRVANAYAECATDLIKVRLESITKSLSSDLQLATFLMKQAILRVAEYEQALAYQITNNTERRLARALLHLSQYDSGKAQPVVIQGVSQEMLSNMVGANRSRINGFMTKFRRLGYIGYNGGTDDAGITVNPSLVAVLFESSPRKK